MDSLFFFFFNISGMPHRSCSHWHWQTCQRAVHHGFQRGLSCYLVLESASSFCCSLFHICLFVLHTLNVRPYQGVLRTTAVINGLCSLEVDDGMLVFVQQKMKILLIL